MKRKQPASGFQEKIIYGVEDRRRFQRVWLDAFIGEREARQAPEPMSEGTAKERAYKEVAEGLHSMNNRKDTLSQEWMRSALFLRYLAMKGGEPGFDALMEAVWAYTAALVDGVERMTTDPHILDWVPKEERYFAHTMMLRSMRRALGQQMTLLSELKVAKAQYTKDEETMGFGKALLRMVHCPNHLDTDMEFRAFVDGVMRYGPGGLPDTDWDAAVALSKAILEYDSKAKERANNAQETALKGDLNETGCKCEGEG